MTIEGGRKKKNTCEISVLLWEAQWFQENSTHENSTHENSTHENSTQRKFHPRKIPPNNRLNGGVYLT